MAVATAAQLLQIFKEVYGHRVEAQANKARVLYTEFQKSTEEMAAGKYWTFPILDEAGWGAVGSRKDGQSLPTATPESPLQVTILPKYHYATIQISGPAIAQSRSKALAFIKGMDLEVNEKTNSVLSLLNRQCYNNSAGELGVELSDTANTITFTTDTNMNWFRKGMRIDIFDATLATKRNGTVGTEAEGRSITVVNKATRTITYSGTDLSGSTVATDRVFLEDVRLGAAATDEGSELAGLRFIIDDTTDSIAVFQNVSGTTFPIWRGNRLFNSGTLRPLSLDLIQSAFDTTEVEAGMEIDYIISGKGQRRAYVNLLWFDARYEPQEMKGGFRILQYAGGDKSIDWRSDKDCPLQQIIGLTRSSIKRYEVQALGILDHENSSTLRIAGKDVYEVLVGGYFNLGATRRNCNVRLGDLQEP
jgi:hypothetical protein